MNYKPVIGLEVHVELKTKSKMFCGCSTDYFGAKPNTHVCPTCLGLPGALPVPNKKAIEWCIKIGLALNCEIPLFSKFDRKNYFYPDLPKGYQISQYDLPFCRNGYVILNSFQDLKASRNEIPKQVRHDNERKIRIRRVHMEEDTGKLIHTEVYRERVSLIDFNRSGVPLVEIVTEPDFESPSQVKTYLQKLQQIVRYLDVSNTDMEKGQMRLEPNISLRPVILASEARCQTVPGEARSESPSKLRDAGQASMTKSNVLNDELPTYKVEVKNINSFKFVEKAINYEIKRQNEILESGKIPLQETRGWDEKKQITVSQRVKEEAMDYRYFPEADIPPFRWKESYIKDFKTQIPELPDEKIERFKKEYNLGDYDTEILTREKYIADYFEESVKIGQQHSISPRQISNIIINKKIDTTTTLPATLVQSIVKQSQKATIDEEELKNITLEILKQNPKAVEDYKKGKKQVIGFLIGSIKKYVKKPFDTDQVKEVIENLLKIH